MDRRTDCVCVHSATGCLITVDDVLQRERAGQIGQETNAADAGGAPSADGTAARTSPAPTDKARTLSFAELKALIEEGKTDQIPNNRQIPNELNVGGCGLSYPCTNVLIALHVGDQHTPPSQSTATARKKPWEAEK